MFSLQQGDELVFQKISSSIEQDQILAHHASLDTSSTDHDSIIPTSPGNKSKRKNLVFGNNPEEDKKKDRGSTRSSSSSIDHENEKKMMAHKEVERQRRQEMAHRYASLRSLLPLEFIKGKRSISDHMQESVNYIKYLENNIQELSIKREKLKNFCNPIAHHAKTSESSNVSVTVSLCWGGVEILVDCGSKEEGFPLSRVLEILLEEGLDVVSSLSTAINNKSLQMIKCEVISDSTCIDVSVLEEKLADAINGKLG